VTNISSGANTGILVFQAHQLDRTDRHLGCVIIEIDSLTKFSSDSIKKQLADTTIAFQSPVFVRVCPKQLGQVIDSDATFLSHLRQEHASNLDRGWIR
jgi:hypothetical protein